jgi:hypothetical protein
VNLSRRRFLTGAVAAPAIILTPGLLMPVRKLWTPPTWEEVIRDMQDAYIVTGVDPAHGYDYGAWVKVAFDRTTGIAHIVDWHPK